MVRKRVSQEECGCDHTEHANSLPLSQNTVLSLSSPKEHVCSILLAFRMGNIFPGQIPSSSLLYMWVRFESR